MKIKHLMVLPVLALLLAGCNNGSGDIKPEDRDFIINCYLDYNHYDPDNPYLHAGWDFDKPFTKADIGLVDPTEAPDPYYPKFLGWSMHALVDEEIYLFDFNTPFSEEEVVGGYIELFGIFVGD